MTPDADTPPAQPPKPLPPPPPADSADSAEPLAPQRDLPQLIGLGGFALLTAGAFACPLLAILAWLFSLPYLAAMFSVLLFFCLSGVAMLEYIRLRGWRYSVRQLILAWLVTFGFGILCTALGYKQYQHTWSREKPLALEYWPELSMGQRRVLSQAIVDGRVAPTLAELLAFREIADYPPRVVNYHGRFVQEFAYGIGPQKLLGQECLVIRIDRDREDPIYTVEFVDTGNWP